MDENRDAALPPALYVNFMRVGYQSSEFFLAFGQVGQDRGAAHLLSSLVTTPAHAKVMLAALRQAVERYEQQHGEIELPASASAAPAAAAAAAPPRDPAGRTQPARKAG